MHLNFKIKKILVESKSVFIFLIAFLFSFVLNAQTQIETFTTPSSSTWTVPADVTKITVEVWGGGGGSGGHGTSNTAGGTGGTSTIGSITALGGGGSFGTIVNGTNTTGGIGGVGTNNGSNGTSGSFIGGGGGTANGGNGGASHSGGAMLNGPTISGQNTSTSGLNGNFPGGGAAGSARSANQTENSCTTGGGGGGAYSTGTLTNLLPSSFVNYTVGAGGTLGTGANANGGAGADGQIRITYSTFSLSTTSTSTLTVCWGTPATISLASNLPDGDYTVSYTLTGNSAGTYTASITATSGAATFNTINLNGSTTLEITNIENASYGNNIVENNTVSVTVIPTLTITGPDEICVGETTQITTSDGGNWSNSNPSVATIAWDGLVTAVSPGTATFSIATWYPACNATSPPITVLTTPTAVSVSGGGANCGSTTLTATGGTGGIVYFQGTTSGGTSTAKPSTSELISTSGTYYFRALSANGCWGSEGSATVSITEIPEITVDNNPSVCQNTTNTNLYYTSTAGNPQGYNIYFDADAMIKGFQNQNGSLPGAGNPIVVQVPWDAPVGVYNATITVKTWSPECISVSFPFTITVDAAITAIPGPINGTASIIQGQNGVSYSITPVSNATSYSWNYTGSGATINGSGNNITIDFSSSATSGNLTVNVGNSCTPGGITSNTYPITVSTGCSAEGSILVERWDGIPGTTIVSLTSIASYPESPTSTSQLTSLEIPTDNTEYYGIRIRGYICAPATGGYTFWIASDDYGDLYLSSDNNPANISRIAYHTGWTNSRQWNKYPEQKSTPVSLTAGEQYYIEILMKENAVGDNLAIGWAKPGEPTTGPSEVIPGTVLSPFIEPVTGLIISPNTATISIGNTYILAAKTQPLNATNKQVIWSSGDNSIATVDADGIVTGISEGIVTITATSVDGGFVGTCTITVIATSGCIAEGSILMERWDGINGTTIFSLTSNINYPDNPTSSGQLASFEIPPGTANNYGVRLRGYICAPATGAYTFWIASDDNGELYLSTDDNSANISRIAYHTGWTNSREWNKYTSQKSASITLNAGQSYYIEALMKEGSGGDNLAVGWAKPGESTTAPSEVIPGTALSPYVVSTCNITATITSSFNDACPELIDIQGFKPESGSYDAGATKVTFTITRSGSTANWSFNYEITDAQVRSISPYPSPNPQQSPTPVSVSGNSTNIEFYINNNNLGNPTSVTLNVFDLKDINNCNGDDTFKTISIKAMPAVGKFN